MTASQTIQEKQNTPEAVRLRAAIYQLHGQASRLHGVRLGVGLALAILGPTLVGIWPPLKVAIALVGGAWTLTAFFLRRTEMDKIKQAVNVQEQFDTGVFTLPWHRVIAGSRLGPELIHSAAQGYRGDQDQLRNWYPQTANVAYPVDVLICQRSNLVWDWRQRKAYAAALRCLVLLIVAVGLAVSIVTGATLLNYLLTWFLPALSIILLAIEETGEHMRVASDKELLEREINGILDEAVQEEGVVTEDKCRDVQDTIFRLRSSSPPVPQWWYRLVRDRYEADMQAAAADLSEKVERLTG